MDHVVLEGLEFEGRHGHYDSELELGNRFRFDIRLEFDTSRAGTSDDLGDTVDYCAAVEAVRRVMSGPRVHLVERLAELAAAEILDSMPRVGAVDLKVMKLKPPVRAHLDAAGVHLIRRRS